MPSAQEPRSVRVPHEPTTPVRVTVILLNFNGNGETLESLVSVRANDYPGLEILVVDNGSTDGSAQLIQSMFPDVHVLRDSNNQGYARGMNRGIIMSLQRGSELVFLLNTDTVVDSTVISELVRFLGDNADVGAAGPRVVLRNELDSEESAPDGGLDRPVDDDSLSGCAVMIRREAIERVGLMDENYFFYWEDVDWWRRMTDGGFRVVYVPTSGRVIHRSGGTVRRYPGMNEYHMTRNEFLFRRRYEPLVSGLCRSVLDGLRRIPRPGTAIADALVLLRAQLRGLLDGLVIWVRNPPVTHLTGTSQGPLTTNRRDFGFERADFTDKERSYQRPITKH